MQAKELMIGDWVYNIHHKKNIQLTAYDFFTHCHDKAGLQYLPNNAQPVLGKDFEPIEITEEFLERNFERNSENAVENVFGIFDDFYDIFIYPLQDGMWVLEYCSCEFDIPSERIHVSWVHELQHFLNHCGIGKELKMED